MKKLLLFAFAALALVSCQKSPNNGPELSPAVTTDSYKNLNIISGGQVVKVSVSGSQLTMVYNEDVTLLLDSVKLTKTWGVRLKEDLSGTKLASYEYHSITKMGINATNWVDDDLNNVVIKSSKDTLVNNRLFVKKRITRTLNYQKTYDNAAAATSVMNDLLKQTDIMVFSAYYAPENPDLTTITNTAKLTYKKM
jgi:hypothetical protein